MSNNLVQTISLKDNGYSKGVKSAKQALEDLGIKNGVENNSFQNTPKELNSAKKFYSQLRTEYEKLSDEAKKGEFGQAMHRQLETTKADLQSLYEQTARTKKELQDMQEQANKKVGGGGGGSSLDFLGGGKGMLKKAGLIGMGISALDTFKNAVGDNIEIAKNFEKAASGVKALTGAGEETMNKLKKSAIDLGGTTTQTASQVLDAFGMIGSQSPELLKNADALSKVTESAIILSEAAGIDLESAAKGVTSILNQFGISASRSKEIINLLAAASQEGAGNIDYLNDSIQKCGSVAGSLNIEVNQVVGVLETLAKGGFDASTAGNNLRNIMLILEQSSDKKLKPSMVGLTKALQNLAAKNLDATQLTKMFGRENVAAAITLTKNAEASAKMAESIQGTNTAIEQQKIMNDNLEGSLKNLSSKWEAFNLSLNQSNGLLKKTIDLVADLVGWFTKLNNTPTTIGGKAVEKINKQYGDANAYQEKATHEEQVKAYNNRKRAIQAEYKEADRLYKLYEKGAKDAKRGKAVQQQQAALAAGQLLKRNALKAELDAYIKSAKDFFYPNRKTQTTTETTTTTTTDTTKKTKTKSPKEIYDEKVADIEAKLANKFIKEKQAIEEKIAATQQYIVALQNIKRKTKQDEQVLTSLKAQEKALEKSLIKATDEEIVSDALKNYEDTIKKLDRQRQNGWITESEYQSQYISAIKSLCKAYDKVTDMSDKLIKEISEKQKEIKDFELKQIESKAATEYLTTFRRAERIYNNGKVARQAPANNLHEAHESAYIQLRTKADHAPEEVLKPGYTPTKKDEDWFRDYQGFLKENKHLLGEMYVKINNIKDAVKHAKKLDLVDTIETEHYKKDAQGNFIKDAQGKLIEDVPYETLIDKYKKDLESVGWKFNFDEEDFKKKVEELGAGTSIPIHFELKPSFEAVDTLAEIAENWKQDDEVYRQIMKFHEDYKKDLEEFKHYVDTWQFPDKLKTRGDASNFSNRKNISYNRLSAKANTFYYGKGRLNQNLVDESELQKKQDQLDKYLAKYKDIETEYTKMREIAEKNGLDFTEVGNKVEADLNDLEKRIGKLHDEIQDRLTFEFQISGALDAVDALGGISNLGAELASIPDTLDSIEESSNDAAAAFQYFGLIINTVQGIIEGIQLVMTVYKGLTDAFTASETAKSIATEADMAAQTQQAGVAESNVTAKSGETAANKALEASALDLAAANIFLAHSYIPFAGPAIAAGLTTAMMGTMTGVHATALSLTAMANGGIVGDGTFSGDQTLIRANKGEMILNTQQQANLFSLLDGVVGTNQGGGNVKFKISGDSLVGVLNNHNRMKAKVGNRLR